jgi:pyocin large subunit-like protein
MKGLVSLLLGALIVFSGAWAHAVELLGEPQVVATRDSATITWKTDVSCGTRLQYGLNAAQLTQKAEGPVTDQHQVVLSGLITGTTYHYSVGSARQKLATGTFTTGAPAAAAAAESPPSMVRRVLDALLPEQKTAQQSPAPPTRQTWGNISTLQDHFDRHGRDFASKSPDDYAAQAWHLLQRARAESLPMKIDPTDGTLRIFDPKTRAFAAYNREGRTKTFFKPESPTYWQRQPGRPAKPSDLRFSSR